MLNPFGMSRLYAGYSQANQSLLEEEEEEGSGGEDRDLEAQRGRNRKSTVLKANSAHNRRPPKEAGGASEMHTLWPNIQKDKPYDQDSSDDEVPQSFMIEAQATRKTSDDARFKGKGRMHASPQTPAPVPSGQDLPSTGRTNAAGNVQPSAPRPSEAALDTKSDRNIPPRPPQTRGLDAYERALWNWVNVYNLDAFLQDVYYYYEGKGIYSIALARGLNLLSAILFPPSPSSTDN
jgi:autophagy-related protein 9